MIRRLFRTALPCLLATLAGCIKNDIPYPLVELRIADIEGEGFTVSENNTARREITLRLDEQTDIRNVRIDKATYDAVIHSVKLDKEEVLGQMRRSQELVGTFDMYTPIYTTLSLYQDYEWTVRAEQTIERRFAVAGQIGASQIDEKNRIARASVATGTDLEHIHVTELKLGPADITTYSPTIDELSDADFRSVRLVDVTCHGRTERWSLFVEVTDSKIAVGEVDLWANTATVTATVSEEEHGRGARLQYRSKDAATWQEAQESSYRDGILTASIKPEWSTAENPSGITVYSPAADKGIFAEYTYEFRLLIGDEQTQLLEYAAASGDTIPGGDMEGSLSCFTSNNATSTMWGSGNNGIKSNLCSAATMTGMGGSQCAKMTASSTLGILASGNLFTATFSMKGTDGTVGFGQKYNYTARPKGLRFKYHATVGSVDIQKNFGGPIAMGEQDLSTIYVCIVDWSARRNVTSGVSKPTGTWDPSVQTDLEGSGRIIAYGVMDISASTEGESLIGGEIPLVYYDTACAAPQSSYTLVISCATSKYGDYMNGCSKNVLYVDDFEWVY